MKWNFLYQIAAASRTKGLQPPDPRSLCPLSSTEFVEPPPPPEQNSWVRHWLDLLFSIHIIRLKMDVSFTMAMTWMVLTLWHVIPYSLIAFHRSFSTLRTESESSSETWYWGTRHDVVTYQKRSTLTLIPCSLRHRVNGQQHFVLTSCLLSTTFNKSLCESPDIYTAVNALCTQYVQCNFNERDVASRSENEQ